MSANRKPRAGRHRLLGVLLALPLLTIAGLSLAATPALAAGASLRIEMTHENAYGVQGGADPYTGSGTTFDLDSGSNKYTITVTNTGGAATSGAVAVTDKLPAGLVLGGSQPTEEVSGSGCSIESQKEVICTTSSLAAGASYGPITLDVHVNPETPLGMPPSGGVTNEVSVSEGGVVVASDGDPTTIAEVPFGIQSFTTSVSDEAGEPFTQADGHPFSANATFVLNTVPDDEVGYESFIHNDLRNVASPKDIETELPPGFIGDPEAIPKCPADMWETTTGSETPCPISTAVGYLLFSYEQGAIENGREQPFPSGSNLVPIYNLVPAHGSAATFGFIGGLTYAHYTLSARVRSDGDYGVTLGSPFTAQPAPTAVSATFCENGVTEKGAVFAKTFTCTPSSSPTATPLLTNPARCEGPAPLTRLRVNSYQEPEKYASMVSYAGVPSGPDAVVGAPGTSGAPSASSSFATGCSLLHFEPEVQFGPSSTAEGGTTQADEPTGATFKLNLPQPEEAGTDATPELKDATVTLPAGMSVDPSAADGLEACSNAQFGLGSTVEPAEPAACPSGSQIGTAEVKTPLLEKPLEGQVFLGQPECSPCSNTDAEDGHLFRLFLQVRSVERGVLVKLAGKVSANPATGQLQASFTEQPQLPFSELVLKLNGGARAPLATPQACGTYTTSTDLTPWSTSGLGGLSGSEPIEGTPDATPASSFNVDWDGAGGACPAGLPFGPSFSAGSQSPTAGASSPFSVTFGREDREQDLSDITVVTPPGLLGKIAGIPRCGEAQANAGSCGAESQIGTVTAGAGPGPDPFYLGGKVYLTGPYKGQPFGLSIVVPAIAGPFNLGDVVVRASIAVNPATAALTITSDPLPQYVDGVQLRLRKISVEVNRPEFMLNPTSCTKQTVDATLTGAQGASAAVSSPFQVGACQDLPFKPSFSAATKGSSSRKDGASLTVRIAQQAGEANIAKVEVQLPKKLSTRDATLEHACTEAQFAANPAGCPAEAVVGSATASTPVLSTPLSGPVLFVSHGGAAFPDLDVILQGEGVQIILTGHTQITKGITYSRFQTVPDAPISSFDLSLPQSPDSALSPNLPKKDRFSFCGEDLVMPVTITGQNGKQLTEKTKVSVEGCKTAKTKKAKLKITKTKLKGKRLLVTVKTSTKGRIRISGPGLKTTTKKLNAGKHKITVKLTKHSKTKHKKIKRKRIKLRARLTAGKHTTAKTTSIKL